MNSKQSRIAHWRELVRFPEWGKFQIRAKLDTGAKSSVIHASRYEIRRLHSTVNRPVNEEIHFNLHIGSRIVPVTAPIIEYRNVKNSGGKIEERPFIETTISIQGLQYTIALSVTNRDKMRFPILLGRSFLAGKFLVDSSGSSREDDES